MKPLHVLQQQTRWLVFDDHVLARSEGRPKLESPALVVADFEGAVSSVISLEGSPAHAVALIQKRLRSDGLIDGECKILIHNTLVRGAGYQTLFTAVPLELWQQTYAWAEAQPDHCLLIPCTSLLWRALRPGHGVVLQSGRQISVLVRQKHEIVYRSALAYSDDTTDLMMTAGALADQVAADLERGDENLDPLDMLWCSALAERPADGTPWPDDMLRDVFSARSGLKVRPSATRAVRDEAGREFRSGIEWLAAHAAVASAVNPATSRLSYLAERLLPLAAAASLVVAVALAAIGARWAITARHAGEHSASIARDVQSIESSIAALDARAKIDPDFEPTRDFIERAARLQTGIDPVAAIRQVRAAADGEVQILRIGMEDARPAAAGMAAPVAGTAAAERVLRVDGMVAPDQGTPGMQVATFVERLRQAGYIPNALDPQAAGVNARTGGGVFSYLLKRPAADATGGTP